MLKKNQRVRAVGEGPSQFRYSIDENGKRIAIVTLTRQQEAILDADDWDRISSQYGELWYSNANSNGTYYARREVSGASHYKGGYHQITMQRAVLEAHRGEYISFANENTLDCRRKNLIRNKKPTRSPTQAKKDATERIKEGQSTANNTSAQPRTEA